MQQPFTTAAILAGVFFLFFALERVAALRKASRPLFGRLAVNLGVTALSIGTAALLVRPVSGLLIDWTARTHFGAVQWLRMPSPARFIIAFLLMDLFFYYWHRANHRFQFLWRFHNAHHIDPDLDVSTGFRFHPGEVVLSTGFRALQVSLIGPAAWMFVAYELVFQIVTLFEHSNLRLPIGLERRLNLLLVTPRMHGIHHSRVRSETDSNYSVIFPWWDWLHRTLRLNIPQAAITIGVPAYAQPGDNSFWNVLAAPFRRQRVYWQARDGSAPERDPATLGKNQRRLEA